MVRATTLLGKDTFDGVKLLGRPIADVKKDFANRPRLQNEKWIANDYSATSTTCFPRRSSGSTPSFASIRETMRSSVTGLSWRPSTWTDRSLELHVRATVGKARDEGDDSVYGIDPVVTAKRTDGQVTYIHVETKAAPEGR